MIAVFKAFDGTLFESAQECFEYEQRMTVRPRKWKGWDWNENPTADTSTAVVVFFCDGEASEQFVRDANLNGDYDIDGFEAGDTGWYYWDEGDCVYRFLQDSFVSTIRKNSVS